MSETPDKQSDGVAPAAAVATAPEAPKQVLGSAPAEPAKPAAAADAKNAQPEGAPESYADFRVPDGLEAFDKDVVTAFGTVAKELNLSQASAQRILDQVGPKLAERQKAQLKSVQAEWSKALSADPEIGGARLTETFTTANKAYEQFASPALRELLSKSGLDGHPEVVRMFARLGRDMADDKLVVPGTETPTPAIHDPAHQKKLLYGGKG